MEDAVKTAEQIVADAINQATGGDVTPEQVEAGVERVIAEKLPTPEQIEKRRGRSDGKPKGGSPAQQAKVAKDAAEKKDAGAPGSLTKAQQTAVAASLSAEPAGVKGEGTEKNVEVTLSDGSKMKVAAFGKLPVPSMRATIALTGRPVTKRTNPAARWSAFMEFYNTTPAAERTVEAYVLFSAKVAAGKVSGRDKDHAPTVSDLQWAAGKGWLVLV